jgi:hypothetical protein
MPDNVSYYENIGTAQQAQMVLRTTSYLPVYMDQPCVWFCDIDNDDLTDLFVGEWGGGILYFHGTDTQVAGSIPQTTISLITNPQFTIGPNPANPLVVASFELRVASNVDLQVFDISGRLVKTLVSGMQPAGVSRYVWDATPSASGVYLIRLQTPEKVVLLK